MNQIDVEINGQQGVWNLSASFQNGCSVMKDNIRHVVNGVRILASMDSYQVCVLISPALDGEELNSVDVFIEDIYTYVPNEHWKHKVADSVMEHLENVYDYCQALPSPNYQDFLSIINGNVVYN